MKVVVHDSLAQLQPLFTSTDPPNVLLERARPLLFDEGGLQWQVGKPTSNKERNGFYVMQAAQQDGFHVLAMQQVWGLFNPTRNRDVSVWQFSQFAQKNVVDLVESILVELCELLPRSLLPDKLECYLFPADPANRPLMINNHGLSGFGFARGYLLLQIWPCDGNLTRLRSLLARLLVHNIRPLPVDRTPTLLDWLVVEGLASGLVEKFIDGSVQAPWGRWLSAPVDWSQTLNEIAMLYGLARYDDLVVNVYSSQIRIGAERLPAVMAMDADEQEYALDLIRDGLDEIDPNLIAAYLYGDEVVAQQGHSGVGLSPYAGFECAHQIVRRCLEKHKLSLVDAFAEPSAEFAQVLLLD